MPHRVLVLALAGAVLSCGGNPITAPSASAVGAAFDPPTAVQEPVVRSTAGVNSIPSPDAPILIAAGDIGDCETRGQEATARLLDTIPGTVLTLGDNVQGSGSAEEYADCYQPYWGRHKSRTRPVPGNHDYNAPGASAYFDYFGERAGPAGRGYYAFRVANWLILALNSEIPATEDSEQVAWVRRTLTLEHADCIAVAWHQPFASSGPSKGTRRMRWMWAVLQEFGVDLALAGHDHFYERLAPLNAAGELDQARGIRSFIVGTGGGRLMDALSLHPASAARARAWGVLKIGLERGGYNWEFISASGVLDRGRDSCTSGTKR